MTARCTSDLIADHLAIAHADTAPRCAAAVAQGASTEDLLLAAIALLRDQAARIAGSKARSATLSDDIGELRPRNRDCDD